MRRLLGMSWTEWRALPWHEQRALREGMHRETNPDAPAPGTDDDLRDAGVTFT